MRAAKRAKTFLFDRLRFSKQGVRFFYQIDGIEYSYFSSLAEARPGLSPEQLYLVAAHIGLSYMIDLAILSLPEQIIIRPLRLSPAATAFWKDVYKRLAIERIYEELLDIGLLEAQWIITGDTRIQPLTGSPHRKTLLAMSGGKESLTALKLLENVPDLELFFLQYPNGAWFHMSRAYAELRQHYSVLKVRADTDKYGEIMKRYQCRDYYTFVIGQLAFHTLLYGDRFRFLVIGNEYSANFGNGRYQGISVNHQYDKSLPFARKLNQYINRFLHQDFQYFSPFFGLYEYRIAQLFLADNRHLDIWTSCNLSNSRANFCCRCHKCAFTYVIALPFSDKGLLSKLFGVDLLEDLDLYKPLMDLKATKPLDCVGEKKEVWLSLYQIHRQQKAVGSPVLRYFMTRIFPKVKDHLRAIEEELNKEHTGLAHVPDPFKDLIGEALRITAYQEKGMRDEG